MQTIGSLFMGNFKLVVEGVNARDHEHIGDILKSCATMKDQGYWKSARAVLAHIDVVPESVKPSEVLSIMAANQILLMDVYHATLASGVTELKSGEHPDLDLMDVMRGQIALLIMKDGRVSDKLHGNKRVNGNGGLYKIDDLT